VRKWANQATTGAATQNGKNVIDFDQTDFFIVPSGVYTLANGANTTFCVFESDDTTRLQVIFGLAEGGSSRLDLRTTTTIGEISFQSRNASGGGIALGSVTETTFGVMMGRRSGTTQAIAYDGGAETTNASGVDEAGVDAASIGGFDESTTFGFDGRIAEIPSYNRSLTALEITKVNAYLSKKWAT